MQKRTFLKLASLYSTLPLLYSFSGCSEIKITIRKLKNRLKPSPQIPPLQDRVESTLPPGGESISVETALNSRCSSDFDDDSTLFHWGIFDKNKRLSSNQINRISSHAQCKNLAGNHTSTVKPNKSSLQFFINNSLTGDDRDWSMIVNGIQQQAAALVCSALGIGNVLNNRGKDGKVISPETLNTVSLRVGPMKPSYSNSYWSSDLPQTESPWKEGNLPNPTRKGSMPLLKAIDQLSMEYLGDPIRDQKLLGQLLWAARGRTPHLYKSTPWGLTIPTWAGKQTISSVYLVENDGLYLYNNWDKNRPTHRISKIGTYHRDVINQQKAYFPTWDTFILFNANESLGRALWEIGYQLCNTIVQALSLNLSYNVFHLNAAQKKCFKLEGCNNPTICVALSKS